MKKARYNREIDDAIELFESSHHTLPTYDMETGHTSHTKQGNRLYVNVRTLKRGHSDYQAGPIKYYTSQEIEDYVKSKALS
jgi:hypothetical protein